VEIHPRIGPAGQTIGGLFCARTRIPTLTHPCRNFFPAIKRRTEMPMEKLDEQVRESASNGSMANLAEPA
jgi:hypothetical protein